MATFTQRLYRRVAKTVKDKGVAVTFSAGDGEGDYDEVTDTFGPSPGTPISGHAVEIPGDPEEYERLDLLLKNPVTLVFVPNTLGEQPAIDSTVTWAGVKRRVSKTFPYRPAGIILATKLMLT